MMLNSLPFIILFPIVVILFRLIPERFRYIWLLVISLAFYATAGPWFLLLLLGASLITYITAIALSLTENHLLKRIVLAGAVTVLLLVLFIFKYLNFAIALTGSPLRFDIVLPLACRSIPSRPYRI